MIIQKTVPSKMQTFHRWKRLEKKGKNSFVWFTLSLVFFCRWCIFWVKNVKETMWKAVFYLPAFALPFGSHFLEDIKYRKHTRNPRLSISIQTGKHTLTHTTEVGKIRDKFTSCSLAHFTQRLGNIPQRTKSHNLKKARFSSQQPTLERIFSLQERLKRVQGALSWL